MEKVTTEKETVEGIILILSCQKHKNTRLKEFSLPKDEYSGWKVIYVLGDFFLDAPYKLDGNMLTVKCEDSYIHLLKKLVLSIQYMYEIFHIKQGILRSGDDLIFNIPKLEEFLSMMEKPAFLGWSPSEQPLLRFDRIMLKQTRTDFFMVDYYKNHPEDFNNPQHNLRGVNIFDYLIRPEIPIGAAGSLYYVSNKCCQILVNHMENINYNVFQYDEYSKSYPYTIEDCAVSFILYFNKVGFTYDRDFIADYNNKLTIPYMDIFSVPELANKVAVATNKYK
jgi:hypothetical protein